MSKNTLRSGIPPAILSPLEKGIGLLDRPRDNVEVHDLGWNLLREDLALPAAILSEERLQHNLDWMQRFMDAYGLKLAPHGKTTMAPRLFERQLRAGAWGITLATVQQTCAAYERGVLRVLMANQLVGKTNMRMIARLLADPNFEFYSLVDSAAQVDQLGAFFAEAGVRTNVLIELGVMGGRTGVRDDAQLRDVLGALSRWRHSLVLAGIEMYEGVLTEEGAIRAFLHRAVAAVQTLAGEGRFGRTPVLLSGAGSAWYDVVAEVFSQAGFGGDVEIVLRPGCYLTHDAGLYLGPQARILQCNPIAREMQSGLLPALQVWAYVLSLPEPGLAIAGMGKRDVAFDAGMPIPVLQYRTGDASPIAAPEPWAVVKLMDQHAFLRIGAGDDLRVGDMIAFDISHPCLTFDKWRVLAIVDSEYNVIDLVETYF